MVGQPLLGDVAAEGLSAAPRVAEAALGAVLVTGATYLALYVQDQAGSAPPVSYASALWVAPILAVGWALLSRLRRPVF